MYDGVGVAVGGVVVGADGVDVAVGGTDGLGVALRGPGMMQKQSKQYCRRENLDTQPQGNLWYLLVLLDMTHHFCCKLEP